MAVYKDKGKWGVDFYVNGKRFRQIVGPNKKDAQTYLGKVIAEIREGKFFDIRKDQQITFEHLFSRYIKEYSSNHHKGGTQQRHKTSSKHLLPFFGTNLLREITPELIQRYVSSRKAQKIANATVNRELALLKHCFSIAIKWGWTRDNPVKRIEMLREPKGRVRFLSDDERRSLFAVLPWYIRPIVLFAMHTGMRKSEILNLQWSQVSQKGRCIVLEDTKNNERRSVPLNNTAMLVLEEVGKIRRLDIPYVFYNPLTGDRWKDVQHAFLRACKVANVKDFRFHDLRHTAASYLVMSGVDLTTVKEILGHKTIEMTLRYAHLTPEHKVNAAKVLDLALTLESKENIAVTQTVQNPNGLVSFWSVFGKDKIDKDRLKSLSSQDSLRNLAGATGLEPATLGFGERLPLKPGEIPTNPKSSQNAEQTLPESGFEDNNNDKDKK